MSICSALATIRVDSYTSDTINGMDSNSISNLRQLQACHKKMKRYRIRRGSLKSGEKVAVVQEVTSFLDMIISFFPSTRALKNRFASSLLDSIKTDSLARTESEQIARESIPIPFVSNEKLYEAYSVNGVYNPWLNLPPSLDKLKYPVNASVANQHEIKKGNQIAFPIDVGDSAGMDAIFSNCINKEYDFCIVNYPGFVSTANCPEVLYQAGRCRADFTLKSAVLASSSTTARELVRTSQCSFKNTSLPEFDNSITPDLMLKILRMRVQQDSDFKNALINTAGKQIFLINPSNNPNDMWGCAIGCDNTEGSSPQKNSGYNLMGRMMVQVREEYINGLIPPISADVIKHNKGLLNTSDS